MSTCNAEWPNAEIPALPHRCVIRPGWHVRHCCHCGATTRVGEQTHPPVQHSGAVPVDLALIPREDTP